MSDIYNNGKNNDDSDIDGLYQGSGADPSVDPYSVQGIQDAINNLLTEMKKDPFFDPSAGMAGVLGDITGLHNNIVTQDANAQVAMSGYLSQMAGIQNLVSDPNGTGVEDVNQYTGQPIVTNPQKYVTPEVALAHQMDYLANNLATPYKQDSNGNAIAQTDSNGNVEKDAQGNTIFEKNPVYSFFNDQANASLKTTVETNLSSIFTAMNAGSQGNYRDGTEGYTFNADGTLNKGSGITTTFKQGTESSKGPPPTYDGGAIKDLWDKTKATPPDSDLIKQLQQSVGTTSTTLTSGSSALQAIAKVDTQNLQTIQGTMNNFLLDIISMNKTMQKAQAAG